MSKEDILHFMSLTIFVGLICIPLYIISDSAQKLAEATLKQKILTEQKIVQLALAKKEAEEKIYLLGEFDQSKRSDFAVVPEYYDVGGYTMYLRKETLDAFTAMAEAAEKNGVELRIASATRNFDYQKNIWDNKWNLFSKDTSDGLAIFKEILEYSAVPGTSRHHWGTEIDINDANVPYFNTEEGEKVYDWMEDNAAKFGFCQTYTAKGPDRPTGYNEEKWHWSYLPLSRKFTQDYAKMITPADIKGFDGDQYVSDFDLINDYVLGINPECL